MAERYEQEIEDCLLAQKKHKSELEKLSITLSSIDDMQTKFATKNEQLTIEEIFTSNEKARTIVSCLIKKIVIDDKKGEIEIEFVDEE